MSRKIGLGDTYFDPDIDGDIDFDFFGTTPASAAAAGDGGAEAAARPSAVAPTASSLASTNNDNLRRDKQGLIHQKSEREISEKHESEKQKQESNSFEFRTFGAVVNFERAAAKNEILNENGRNPSDDDFEMNNTQQQHSHPNRSAESQGQDARNAEEGGGGDEEGVKNVNTEPSIAAPTANGGAGDEDDPVFSECDSASDLYSLTDDESFEDRAAGDDDDDYLDSDITEVSPLSSANMSPLPESPKRTPEPKLKRQLLKNHSLSPSPKLQGDRRVKGEALARGVATRSGSSSNGSEPMWGRVGTKSGSGTSSCSGSETGHDTVDLKVLAKAILELEEERKRNGSDRGGCRDRQQVGSYARPRKNMTFTNDEVRRIDHENKRLLRRIIDSQKPRKQQVHLGHHAGRVASSAINRVKELRKIETENLVLLKRLQAAKPTRELSREFLLGSSPRGTTPSIPESKSSSSLASFATAPGGGRGRASRCHSTGSLSSAAGTWAVASSAASSVKSKPSVKSPAKNVAAANGI